MHLSLNIISRVWIHSSFIHLSKIYRELKYTETGLDMERILMQWQAGYFVIIIYLLGSPKYTDYIRSFLVLDIVLQCLI